MLCPCIYCFHSKPPWIKSERISLESQNQYPLNQSSKRNHQKIFGVDWGDKLWGDEKIPYSSPPLLILWGTCPPSPPASLMIKWDGIGGDISIPQISLKGMFYYDVPPENDYSFDELIFPVVCSRLRCFVFPSKGFLSRSSWIRNEKTWLFMHSEAFPSQVQRFVMKEKLSTPRYP